MIHFWIKAFLIGVVEGVTLYFYNQWLDRLNWSNFIKEQQKLLEDSYSLKVLNYQRSYWDFDSSRFCVCIIDSWSDFRNGVLECFKKVNGGNSSVYKHFF